MADNGSIQLRGRVLDVQLRQGTTTKGQPYRFHIVSVLTGKAVSEVRWPSDVDALGDAPAEDSTVNLNVALDVFNNRLQIEAVSKVAASVVGGARVAS